MNSVVRVATVLLGASIMLGAPTAAFAAEPDPDDVCSNIAEVQSVPPEGFVSLVDGTCVAAQLGTAPTDADADSGPVSTSAPTDSATPTPAPSPSETATAAAPYASATTPPRMDVTAARAAGFGILAAGVVALVGGLAYRRRSLR